jgi:ketosteroid isomerase-like protein
MSREDVEIVRRSFDAWNAGDLEAVRDCYTEDAVIQTPITEFGRTFEGDDPIGRWAAEMGETWAEVRWDVERICEGDGVVVSFYRSISVGRQSGIEVVRDLTGVTRIRDGLIASERVYLDRGEALEAAGLSE